MALPVHCQCIKQWHLMRTARSYDCTLGNGISCFLSELDDGSAGAEREFNLFTPVAQFVVDLPFADDR